MSRYQKDRNQKGKTNVDLLDQEIVSGSGICWAKCKTYSLRPPGRHMGSPYLHSTHPQSSSLHSVLKPGSLSDIEKTVLPPACFTNFNFYSTRSQELRSHCCHHCLRRPDCTLSQVRCVPLQLDQPVTQSIATLLSQEEPTV